MLTGNQVLHLARVALGRIAQSAQCGPVTGVDAGDQSHADRAI